ncbi:unnamed protein product [Medioppia subpectinata]|uniref:Uncharacterized protein n=1 Tax=Medioppia subpectinata TaxID=1979941 RepID=A0A7R9KIW6_9ACAR|nr:unnamed protein product [Medioppia subpectinata]CAG2104528.1 unnamed protein product [Medioppia subpectinata]
MIIIAIVLTTVYSGIIIGDQNLTTIATAFHRQLESEHIFEVYNKLSANLLVMLSIINDLASLFRNMGGIAHTIHTIRALVTGKRRPE